MIKVQIDYKNATELEKIGNDRFRVKVKEDIQQWLKTYMPFEQVKVRSEDKIPNKVKDQWLNHGMIYNVEHHHPSFKSDYIEFLFENNESAIFFKLTWS